MKKDEVIKKSEQKKDKEQVRKPEYSEARMAIRAKIQNKLRDRKKKRRVWE